MPCHIRKRRGRSRSATEKSLGNAALINSAAVCHLLQWEIYAVISLSVVARKTKGMQSKFVDTVLWKLLNRSEALMWWSWILFWLGIRLQNVFSLLINSLYKLCRWQGLLQTATTNIDKKLTCVHSLWVVTEYSNVFFAPSGGQNFYKGRDLKKPSDLRISLGEVPRGRLKINRTKVPEGNLESFLSVSFKSYLTDQKVTATRCNMISYFFIKVPMAYKPHAWMRTP